MGLDFNKQREPSTLAQKMGFVDNDLKTPKHDAIMFWLDGFIRNSSNMGCFIRFSEQLWDALREEQQAEATDDLRGSKPLNSRGTICKSVTWEAPVASSGSNFVAGFIDLIATYHTYFTCRCQKREWDAAERDYITKYSWRRDYFENTMAFEVKSKIYSVGEVVRQVRFYESKLPKLKGQFCIVAPQVGPEIVDLLGSQNIGFLAVPPEILEAAG